MMSTVHQRLFPGFAILLLTCSLSSAGVLYSNLQGNYLSQQTGSITVDKGTVSSSGYSRNFDNGDPAFGDDYTVDASAPTSVQNGVTTVQISAFSYYGTLTPFGGNPSGSNGAQLDLEFFSKNSDGTPNTNVFQLIAVDDDSVRGGPSLHHFVLPSVTNIPASGFFLADFGALTTNNASTGATTYPGYGDYSMTGYFGGAPTVGSSNPNSYFSSSNYNRSVTPAVAGSPAYLQVEFDSTPEPSPVILLAVSVGMACLIRRRPAL